MIKFLNIKLENRIVGLDLMRTIAILSVLFGHLINIFYNHLDLVIPLTNLSLKRFIYFVVMGFDGVDLFFVLSGFLIGHSILTAFKNNQLNINYLIHNFWIKRWFRTLPNYFFILIILMLISFISPLMSIETTNNVSPFKYFLFIQNFFKGELAFFPESWSLSIEEWFYISFPIILTASAFITKNEIKRKWILLTTILSIILVGTILRLNYSSNCNFEIIKKSLWNGDIRTSVIMRFDAIMYGVLMAFLKIYFSNLFFKRRYLFLSFGVFILIIAFKTMFLNANEINGYAFSYTWYFTFVGLGMSLMLPFFNFVKILKYFPVILFTVISVISYSLYLINYSLIQLNICRVFTNDSILHCVIKFTVTIFLTFILSIFLFKFIETPFMNYRKKLLNE